MGAASRYNVYFAAAKISSQAESDLMAHKTCFE